jgi:HSP20 family protein
MSSQSSRRGDPVAEIEQLQDRMGNLLQSFFADPFPSMTTAAVPVWVPPADIEETDDAYLVEIDLPGVRAEDVNLELRDNNELRISGEYRERERSGILRRQTRRTGQFEYVVMLPGEVDPEKIDASLEDGVLTVRLGKSMGGQPRRIEIKGMGGASHVQGDGGNRAQGSDGGNRAQGSEGTGQARRSEHAGQSQGSGSGGARQGRTA